MSSRWRPGFLALIALTVGAAACGSAPEPPKRPRPVHIDSAHEESEATGKHGERKSLASLGSPLIHKGDTAHKTVEIRLMGEVSASARRVGPLASLGSPLILPAGSFHHHEPILMIHEGGTIHKAGNTSVASENKSTPTARVSMSSPTPGPIDVGLSGTVTRIDGRVMTIRTERGERSVNVPVSTRVFQDVPGVLADIVTGEQASVIKRPDGTARSIHIYPRGMPAPDAGMEPLTGADQGMILITGIITGLYPGSLVLAAEGQVFPLSVNASTRVIKTNVAAMPELSAGRRVNIKAVQQPSGATTAVAIHLADGLPPPPDVATPTTLRPLASPAASPAASPSAR